MTQTPSEILKQGPAIVTGAGGGLGRELARKLAAQGVPTAVLGRTMADLEETCTAQPNVMHPVLCDVADPSSVQSAVIEITDTFGAPRILVNNAATYPRRDVLDTAPAAFMNTVATNLGGIVNCTSAVLPHMTKDGFGRIVNVATYADIAPIPLSAEYSVSKGAARIYTRALLADIGDRFPNIVVGDWMPGMLATRMGIADGLAPDVAAGWGAALALWHDPALSGVTFEMDREVLQGSRLKRHLKAIATLSAPQKARIIRPV